MHSGQAADHVDMPDSTTLETLRYREQEQRLSTSGASTRSPRSKNYRAIGTGFIVDHKVRARLFEITPQRHHYRDVLQNHLSEVKDPPA